MGVSLQMADNQHLFFSSCQDFMKLWQKMVQLQNCALNHHASLSSCCNSETFTNVCNLAVFLDQSIQTSTLYLLQHGRLPDESLLISDLYVRTADKPTTRKHRPVHSFQTLITCITK